MTTLEYYMFYQTWSGGEKDFCLAMEAFTLFEYNIGIITYIFEETIICDRGISFDFFLLGCIINYIANCIWVVKYQKYFKETIKQQIQIYKGVSEKQACSKILILKQTKISK